MSNFEDIGFSKLNTDDLSRGFWELDVPTMHIISMPICSACKNEEFNEEGRICAFREKVVEDKLQSENCTDLKTMCKDFEADEESCWYPMLMEHVEKAKKRIKK